MRQQDVLYFWFTECTPQDWFKKNLDFDHLLHRKFGNIHAQAAAGELSHWRETPEGILAEIIVLDQFSRNMFRGTAGMFSTDNQTLTLAQELVRSGRDKRLSGQQRVFAYMPFMHSESLKVQNDGVALFEALGIEENIRFMVAHRDVIVQFGRFPHRNEMLGRVSTEEEVMYIEKNGGF